jgi:DNA mismatch endonuclease, patch repair protein
MNIAGTANDKQRRRREQTGYPLPTSAAVSAVMRANRKTDTKPELAIRRILHRRGLRYRVNARLSLDETVVRPDLVFRSIKLAVFVDGCFWHGCPEHGTQPRANTAYWSEKLNRNRARDRRNDAALRLAGWTAMRIWEHEEPAEAADRIEATVRGLAAKKLHGL